MPLGAGYSVEEELTGKAEVGGMQLQTFPMRAEAYFEREVALELPSSLDDILRRVFDTKWGILSDRLFMEDRGAPPIACESAMGLGAGGRMLQEIYADPHQIAVWDQTRTARCFVHLANSMTWCEITGANSPHPPFTARENEEASIPWFDYYRDDLRALKGSKQLATVKSVVQLGAETKSQPLTDNHSIQPGLVIQYGNTRRPIEIHEVLGEP